LATELGMGTARHRLTLAWLAGQFASHGWEKVSPELQPILLMAVYQILWLDRVPDFAAVDEAVEQARYVSESGACRFVNAVLRHLIRAISTRRALLADSDPARTIPLNEQEGVVYVGADSFTSDGQTECDENHGGATC